MKLNKDVKVALRLIELLRAYHQPVTLLTLMEANAVNTDSFTFLQQVAVKLKNGGIIGSKRGPGGGYFMPNRTVSALDVCVALGHQIARDKSALVSLLLIKIERELGNTYL